MSVGAPAYRQLPAVAFNCFSLYRLDINKPRRFPETKMGGRDCLLVPNRCVWAVHTFTGLVRSFCISWSFAGVARSLKCISRTRYATLLDRTARVDQERPQTVLKRLVDLSALKGSCHGDSSLFSRPGKFRNTSTDRGREN